MSFKASSLLVGLTLTTITLLGEQPTAIVPEKHLDLMFSYCMDCHDADTQKGKVNLEDLPLEVNTLQHAELWQKVLDVLNSGEMPPENKKQPEKVAKADFLEDLAKTMVLARKKLSDSGGQITMRRLNRREYQNTIQSLTGVSLNVDSLPADGGSGTFDTVGASQYISSDQFEQYLELGRTAVDEAFERLQVSAKDNFVFRVEPEKTINEREKESLLRFEESAKRFYDWKAKVDLAAATPENREYMENFRKEYPTFELNAPRSHKFYFSAGQLIGAPDARNFGFKDDFDATFTFQSGYDRLHAYITHYHSLPKGDHGSYLKLGWGIQRVDILPPRHKIVPGTYRIRIRAGAVMGSPASRQFIDIGHPQRVNQVPEGFAGLPISTHQVTGTIESPRIIETFLKVGKNTPREFSIREKQHSSEEETRKEFFVHKRENGYGTPPAVWIDWIELEGPIQDKQSTKLQITRVEPEKTINPANEEYIKQVEARQERFKQWKKGVDQAAKSPENQAIIAEIRKKNRLIDHPNRFYTFAEHFEGVPDPRDFGFIDCHKAAAADPSRSKNLALHKHYVSLPHRDTGSYLKLTQGTGRVIVPAKKKDLKPGKYVVRVRVGAVKGTPAYRRFIEVGHPQRDIDSRNWGLKGKPIGVRQVTGTIEAPQIIEFPIELRPGMPHEFAVQEKQPNTGKLKVLWDDHNRLVKENGYGHPPAIWIDWVELEGPIPNNYIPKSSITRVEAEQVVNPKQEEFIKGKEKWFERFKLWKKGVDAVVNTPANQAIIAEIAKRDKSILAPHRFYSIADRLNGTPDAKDFGFNDAPNANSANPVRPSPYKYFKHYVNLPHRDNGAYLMPTKGPGRVVVSPEKLPRGKYTLRARVGLVEGSDPSRHFIQFGHPQRMYNGVEWDYGLEGRSISTHQVTGTIGNPQIIEIPIDVGPDTPREFAVQEKQPNNGNAKSLWKTYNAAKKENGFGIPPAIWIDWIELEGPHNPSRPKTFTQRREVEHHANAKVGGKYENYFKAGYKAGLAFLKDGIPRPEVGVKDKEEANFRIGRYNREGPSQLRYLKDPLTKTGSLLGPYDRNGNLNSEEIIELKLDSSAGSKKADPLPLGKYKVRFRMGSIEGTPTDRHFAVLGSVEKGGVFNLLETFQVTGTTDDPHVFETFIELTLDSPRRFALREKSNLRGDDLLRKNEIYKGGMAKPPAIWIDWVEWEGPVWDKSGESGLVTTLQNNLHGTLGSEEVRARSIFHQFCLEAFRQVDPSPQFIDKLIGLFKTRRKAGNSFDVAIRTPLSVILASPGFLYLDEPNTKDSKRSLNDRELAVRLAYFLWSAPPDARLYDLAEKGLLSKSWVLRKQVDRMIADPRANEFVSGFVHQWLHMERLDFFQFDTKLHREFDESVRASARQEVYESFALLLRDQKGGRRGKLLKSDYVMINGLLGTYYGIEGVTGDHFRKVSLPSDSPRGGLLGTAAVLAMGSDGIESSPVERGAWVLRYLLNDSPPPAPPNVPQLSRLAEKPLTARERVLAHQEEPQCASCHRKIDPIGFGLENFTAAGKWRTEDKHGKKTYEIDPSGKFHKGPEFSGYFEMRDLIAQKENDFARGFTEHLIGYGLGRPFGFTDEDLANEITSAAKKEDHSISAFVHALVQSKAFITK